MKKNDKLWPFAVLRILTLSARSRKVLKLESQNIIC